MKTNPHVALSVRNAVCSSCSLSANLEGLEVCQTAQGSHTADVLVVTKFPLMGNAQTELLVYLKKAGFDIDKLAFTGAVKCVTWNTTPTKTHIKACKSYLDAEIAFIKPKWILALGNEALLATLGKTKITEHRGRKYPHPSGATVVPTIAPSSLYRNPGQQAGFEADLSYCYNMFNGVVPEESAKPGPGQYQLVDSQTQLRAMLDHLDSADHMYFDIESTGFDEFDSEAKIISLSVTVRTGTDMRDAVVWAVPLWHPQSVWRSSWRNVLRIISRHINNPRRRIAHNGKFDCRWLKHFGCPVNQTFDTMLAAHLLDEDRPKGLKPLARILLGAEPWDIAIGHGRSDKPWWELHSLYQILWYNALDTWHGMRLYDKLRPELLKESRLANLFLRMTMPASNVLVDSERRGVWADRELVSERWNESAIELKRIDNELLRYVPKDHPGEVNWNPSNFLRWFLFEHMGISVLARGKTKEDGTPGAPSVAEAVMLTLQEMMRDLLPGAKTEYDVITLLLERTKWQKYTSSFFSRYAEMMDDNDRIHTTFKLTGTVTGRLSSGKADTEKLTGIKKSAVRGVNLQQVPRDVFVRGVFGAPPGSYFVEADYSQIELRVAAFLAQERTMLRLYATGQDIHMAMAMRMTGKPAHRITKEERKKAKAVNFGFLYGMGWRKFVATAWQNYGIHVAEAEAMMFRKAFFDQFPGLQPWHAAQRSFANKYGYVISPLGRVRHLPDIRSRDREVRAEAERQAINSPVQGFASDMALMSLVVIQREFNKRDMKSAPIGTVHDAINFEIPREEMREALPIIKQGMETLQLDKWYGINLNVPIIADLKAGKYWGGAKELTLEQIDDWSDDFDLAAQ